MSTTAKDAWIPEIWSKKLLETIHQVVTMQDLVNTDYEGDIKNAGDTVHARLPALVTTRPYTRETDITYDALTLTDTTFVIDQQYYYAFGLDDLDDAQLDVSFWEKEIPEAAIAIRDTIDTRLLSHYANVDALNVTGSTGAPIGLTKDNVYAYFNKQNTLLENAKAKGKRVCVVPPIVKEMILNSPQLSTRGSNLVDDTVENGLVIKNFAGFQINATTNMAQVSNTYPLMFFTKRFISFAMQFKKTGEKIRLEKQFGTGYRGIYLYGSKVFTQYDGDGATMYCAAS